MAIYKLFTIKLLSDLYRKKLDITERVHLRRGALCSALTLHVYLYSDLY